MTWTNVPIRLRSITIKKNPPKYNRLAVILAELKLVYIFEQRTLKLLSILRTDIKKIEMITKFTHSIHSQSETSFY